MGKALKNLLMVLASQIPVVGVAVVWWSDILRHPIVAAVLAVVYESIVIAWGVLGKDVWEKLKPKVVAKVAEWVEATVPNLFSSFGRRYNQQVIYDHRVFNVRGLRTKGVYIEVEQVFVELNIAHSNLAQASLNPVMFKDLSGSQSIWKFLQRFKKREATALAIIGPPGCGKTTLLQHLALTFAAKRHRRYQVRKYIPLLLFLREHAKTIIDESLPLAELAQRYFSDQTRFPELDPPPDWFPRQLRHGKCLVLLDGLDEVVDVTQRQAIATWVDQQISNYPRCHFLLTARPQGYRDAPLSQAHVLEVMSFNPAQVKKFIQNWYLATKLIAYGKDDPGVRQDASREAQDLLDRLRTQPQLEKLTVNPLLLTMIANVHNYRGVLPKERVKLYAEICDVLLEHWQEAKKVQVSLTAEKKRVILQPLAEAMMTRKVREISRNDALDVIKHPLIQVVGVADYDAITFLDTVQASSGLVLEKEAGVWGFAHLTFQEYLCAAHWEKTEKTTDWDSAQWKTFITDSWWHETLRLYAAQTDATPLLNACLQTNDRSILRLADDIAKEALQVDQPVREAINKALKGPDILLRNTPLLVSPEEYKRVFKLGAGGRPLEYIQNTYEDRGKVVIDHVTGLMWQKSGSTQYMPYEQALAYVQQRNDERFAGYDDWRLPTIPELMSLLEPEKKNRDLYIDPIFDVTQRWCWSADRRTKGKGSSGSAWLVAFSLGDVDWSGFGRSYYVRVVRSRQ